MSGFVRFAAAIVMIAGLGFAASPVALQAVAQTADQAPAISVTCKSNQIVLPANAVQLSFETGGLCSDLAKATQKSAQGKKLSAREAERVKLVTWLDANLAAGERVTLDRFGRGTLMRCAASAGEPGAIPMPKTAPRIGDGAYEMYLLIELPPGAGGCPGLPSG